jgi:hypothetical protein
MTPKQSVERITISAYLNPEVSVDVDAILVNNELKTVDTKGMPLSFFDDLETDVREGLRFLGYQVSCVERDPVIFTFFRH